jgi:hypothetical protein
VAALLALVSCSKADNPPAVQWMRTFSALARAQGAWVETTADGGFAVAGWTNAVGGDPQYYLVKTDSLGNLAWERTFGESNALCLRLTRDGGYIIAGWGTECFEGAGNELTQPYVVKTDSQGLLQWQRVYYYDTLEYGYCITETPDGGYCLLASNPGSDSGMVLFKLDSTGAVQWQLARPGPGWWVEARSVEQTADSGFVVGWTRLTRLTPSGSELWSIQHDHVAQANHAIPTHDGGFVATGPGFVGATPSCSSDVYLLKTDGDGGLQWRRKWGGHGNDVGSAVRQTADHGYAVAATFGPWHSQGYGCLIRTDSSGETRWTAQLPSTSWAEAKSLCIARDGGYVIAGTMPDSVSGEPKLALWRLAPEGE